MSETNDYVTSPDSVMEYCGTMGEFNLFTCSICGNTTRMHKKGTISRCFSCYSKVGEIRGRPLDKS